VTKIVHFIQSVDPKTGGVAEAVLRLNEELKNQNISSSISSHRNEAYKCADMVIAHGLWQWPGVKAWKCFRKYKTPYMVFPHGMLDPWFKRSYPLKHIKKQIYWYWKQGKILQDAYRVCFTTEEERRLAQKTFKPYKANEMISGLGVSEPPSSKDTHLKAIYSLFPDFKNKKVLLYLGRFHPKKGVDLLINSFLKQSKKNDILLLAGPLDNADPHLKYLKEQTHKNSNQIVWSGMLKDDLKWGALRMADALILPSHQENFGMVIAEALSVETPVFLTNKVNLWREVLDSGAGIVSDDDQGGIDHLIQQWVTDVHYECLENASKCFREKLHISQTVEKIISIFPK
jgi:glycosyltransferase involved in cell wall biosynthesis